MRPPKLLITSVLSLLTLEAAQSRLWKSSYEEPQHVAAPTHNIIHEEGIHDASYVLQESRRVLNDADEFQKQDCNLGDNDWYEFTPCVHWDSLFPQDSTEEIAIPCGACVTMKKYKNGELFNLGGLNILGKLEIPDSSKLTITTPYVFVQGILKMTSTAQVQENPYINIVLTNDTDVSFVPNGVNADLCPSGGCNVGSRPVVVAGGRLELKGLNYKCPTWSYSRHITTVAEFVDSTDKYIEYEETPIEFNFTDGIGSWFGNLGAKATHVTGGPSPHLKVYDRIADWQGPFFDIPVETRRVMGEGHNYVWSAKVKLSRADGGSINCVTNSTHCLSLMINRMDSQDRIAWYTKVENIPVIAANTWQEIGGTFQYQADEINVEHVFSALTFRGPEAGVDISLDNFKVSNRDKQMAFENAAQGISICEDLIENGDGDEYADKGLVYPFTSWFKAEELTLETEEDGNNYFYLKDRHVPYSTIKMTLEPKCTIAGAKYQFYMRIQVESTATVRPRVMLKITHPDGYERKHSFDLIALCDPVNKDKGWVDCYRSEYTFTELHEEAAILEVLVVIPDDTSSSVKYDDISFVPFSGIKMPRSTDKCWGPDTKVLLASKGAYNQEQTALIASSDDGSITFKSPITLPAPDSGGEQFPNEIALLSRNIMFTSDSDTNGGHLTVLRTSDKQIIDGVAFKGFGQEGVAGRFVSSEKL